ncbi:MAG: sulfatase-like hydrolase/transferase [Caldilineaceae bacterium]
MHKHPPNILLVLADDHGQWSLGCYGNTTVQTPNMDFLASNGVRFDNAFTPCPVCSPARASLFTGRIPSQHGVHDFLSEDMEFSTHPWLADEILLSQLLQRAGYQTGLVGKWHCTADGHNPQPGFDYWVSYDVRKRGWINQYEHSGVFDVSVQGQTHTRRGFQSQLLTEEALRFLHDRNFQQPFFLTVGYVDTHFPFAEQPTRLVEQYRHMTPSGSVANASSHLPASGPNSLAPGDPAECLAQYYAGVSMIDHQLGTLLDHLEGQGWLDNTLVVYTSDHGHLIGQHGLYGKGNATIPQNFFAEAIRIPMLMRWPEGGLTPSPNAAPFDHCDLFATILDATGVTLTGDEQRRIDSPGQSILSMLRGQRQPWRDYQCCEYGNARMITDLTHKLVRRYPPIAQGFGDEFFDLAMDPIETVNRIGDAQYQNDIQRLHKQLDEFYSRYEIPARAGKQILELPPHNRLEPWRSTPN